MRALIIVALLVPLAQKNPPQSLPDPWRIIRTYVERFAGTDPVDCGQHRDDRDYSDRLSHPPRDEAKLQDSLACAERSRERKTPFWTVKQEQGIDAWVAVGLLGQQDGSVHVFYVCLGTFCPEEFSMKACLSPAVRTDKFESAHFDCARWATGPNK
jgi:hypothetical protein